MRNKTGADDFELCVVDRVFRQVYFLDHTRPEALEDLTDLNSQLRFMGLLHAKLQSIQTKNFEVSKLSQELLYIVQSLGAEPVTS